MKPESGMQVTEINQSIKHIC